MGVRAGNQFTEDIQPLPRRERLVVFDVRLVSVRKRMEGAGHFFHWQSISRRITGGQAFVANPRRNR